MRVEQRSVYGSLLRGDLHCNCDKCCRHQQVGQRHCNGVAADRGFTLAHFSKPSNRRSTTVFCFRFRHHQHGCYLGDLRWKRVQQRSVYGSLLRGDLHCNCDKCCRHQQVGQRHCNGVAVDRGFTLAHFSEHSSRRSTTIHGLCVRNELHGCQLVRIRRHNHQWRTVHCAEYRGNLHRKSSERSRPNEIRFGFGGG